MRYRNNNTLIKWMFGILFSILCTVLALITPAGLWLIWHLANPQNELTRTIMAAALLMFGGSTTVLMGIMSFGLWATLMGILVDP
jgi:membrane protease YdiL (CAAX protease family)